MRIINPKCSNEDSLKYSILLSLHYYDISHNPERITKLRKYEHHYNFTHNTPRKFETDNPNISLATVDDNNNNIIYHSSNNTSTKAKIVKINDNTYAGIKPTKNKYIKFIEFIKSCTHEEIRDMIMEKIIYQNQP